MTAKAQRVIRELFDVFFNDPALMPDEHEATGTRLESSRGPAGRARAVADYIAGMTDRYALLEHRRLFEPSERT
jgi:dGTPase